MFYVQHECPFLLYTGLVIIHGHFGIEIVPHPFKVIKISQCHSYKLSDHTSSYSGRSKSSTACTPYQTSRPVIVF